MEFTVIGDSECNNYNKSDYHIRFTDGPVIAEIFYLGFTQEYATEVEQILDRLFQDKHDITSRIRLADIFREKFLIEQSIEEYKVVLEYDPNNKEALMKLAHTYSMPEVKLLLKAQKCLERILELDPRNQEVIEFLDKIQSH
ncbi:tetratricopeptide repeat protein [Candidatus Woesearchaeota archaeon]|nr:tetratricopeptide repeat protein [Candidatus Woesearchaeota archaeon]